MSAEAEANLPIAAAPVPPTVFHITHYKAGSQWLAELLRQIAGERIVEPRGDLSQFTREALVAGSVYPTLYVTHEQFSAARPPMPHRRFVVIRDPRDALVSGYFSLLRSHPDFELAEPGRFRAELGGRDVEAGLERTMRTWLPGAVTEIQESWLAAGEPVIRFEDLVGSTRRVELLLERCGLSVGQPRLDHLLADLSFERLSGGREPGEEDRGSHWRKGVAGDWRNHLGPRLRSEFKRRWGSLLIAAGYESGEDW